jgi:hypothetical protein
MTNLVQPLNLTIVASMALFGVRVRKAVTPYSFK